MCPHSLYSLTSICPLATCNFTSAYSTILVLEHYPSFLHEKKISSRFYGGLRNHLTPSCILLINYLGHFLWIIWSNLHVCHFMTIFRKWSPQKISFLDDRATITSLLVWFWEGRSIGYIMDQFDCQSN